MKKAGTRLGDGKRNVRGKIEKGKTLKKEWAKAN